MTTTKWIPVDDIRADGGTQTRAELRPDTIDEYAEAMANDAEFPPVDVFWDGNGHYWLADGFHRYQAALKSEREKIQCRIHKGELRDAIWFALAANTTNGIRRTNVDKRRCVTIALSDKEWQEKPDQELADHIGVHQTFVLKVRNELMTIISSTPERRVGRDGKKRPAKYKPRRVAVVEDDEPDDSPPPSRASAEEIDHAQAIVGRMKQKQRALGVLDDLCLMLEALGLSDELSDHIEAIREQLSE